MNIVNVLVPEAEKFIEKLPERWDLGQAALQSLCNIGRNVLKDRRAEVSAADKLAESVTIYSWGDFNETINREGPEEVKTILRRYLKEIVRQLKEHYDAQNEEEAAVHEEEAAVHEEEAAVHEEEATVDEAPQKYVSASHLPPRAPRPLEGSSKASAAATGNPLIRAYSFGGNSAKPPAESALRLRSNSGSGRATTGGQRPSWLNDSSVSGQHFQPDAAVIGQPIANSTELQDVSSYVTAGDESCALDYEALFQQQLAKTIQLENEKKLAENRLRAVMDDFEKLSAAYQDVKDENKKLKEGVKKLYLESRGLVPHETSSESALVVVKKLVPPPGPRRHYNITTATEVDPWQGAAMEKWAVRDGEWQSTQDVRDKILENANISITYHALKKYGERYWQKHREELKKHEEEIAEYKILYNFS